MTNYKLFFAAILLAGPMLHAQGSEPGKAPDAAAAAKPEPKSEAGSQATNERFVSEPYRITINFKTMDRGKTVSERSYTLVATTNEMSPDIRDDSRAPLRVGAGDTHHFEIENSNTDVDIRGFRKLGDSVYLSLTISTESVVEGATKDNPDAPPIRHNHHYGVSPTLAPGKTVTVYSAVDAVNDTRVEVQVRVDPLSMK